MGEEEVGLKRVKQRHRRGGRMDGEIERGREKGRKRERKRKGKRGRERERLTENHSTKREYHPQSTTAQHRQSSSHRVLVQKDSLISSTWAWRDHTTTCSVHRLSIKSLTQCRQLSTEL